MNPLLKKIVGTGDYKDRFIIKFKWFDKPDEEALKTLDDSHSAQARVQDWIEEKLTKNNLHLHEVVTEILFEEETKILPARDPEEVAVPNWNPFEKHPYENVVFKNKIVPVEYYILLVSKK